MGAEVPVPAARCVNGMSGARHADAGRNKCIGSNVDGRGIQNHTVVVDHRYAQYFMDKLYFMGRNVPHDMDAAIHWLNRAADQSSAYVQFFLERLDDFKPPSVMLSVTRLLHHMGNIF